MLLSQYVQREERTPERARTLHYYSVLHAASPHAPGLLPVPAGSVAPKMLASGSVRLPHTDRASRPLLAPAHNGAACLPTCLCG